MDWAASAIKPGRPSLHRTSMDGRRARSGYLPRSDGVRPRCGRDGSIFEFKLQGGGPRNTRPRTHCHPGAPDSALYVRTYYRYPVKYRFPFKTRVRLLGALPRHRAHREHWTYRARPEEGRPRRRLLRRPARAVAAEHGPAAQRWSAARRVPPRPPSRSPRPCSSGTAGATGAGPRRSCGRWRHGRTARSAPGLG